MAQYRVSIAKLEQAGEGNGFVDHTRLEIYRTLDKDDEATSLEKALEKERANMRWEEIVQRVSTYISPIRIIDINAVGANANTAPTTFEFTLVYDRDDYVLAHDELNPPDILYGADALKRLVALALANDIVSSTIVLDPTPLTGVSGAYGESIRKVTAAKAAADIESAEAAITVTKL